MERYDALKGRALLFLIFIWCLWFMNFTLRTIFGPILPLVEDEFAISHARASSVFVFQSLGYGISVLFSGFLAGPIGHKRSITISLLMSAVIFFLMPLFTSFAMISTGIFVLGLSAGMYMPSIMPIITERFSERIWGKTISIHDSAAAISIFSTPFVALAILHFLPWRGIFAVLGVVFLVGAIVFAATVEELKITQSRKILFGGLLRNKTLWLMCIVWVFGAGANLGVFFMIPLYLTKELGLPVGYANTVLGVARLGGVIVALSAGYLVDRFSVRPVMFTVLVLAGLLTILLSLVPVSRIGITLFFQASMITGFFPIALVAIPRAFGREERSAATGIILAFSVVFGWGIIPYLFGVSGDMISFRFGLFVLGILVVLSSGITVMFRKESV